ncbi:hypothetical protein BHM03_00028942, partial [Ensete ventricosum]
GSKTCEGTYFVPIEDSKVCHDYQEIKIQESTQLLGVGSIPRSIPVILMNDLVDMVKAGGITICDALILKPRLRLEGDEDKIAGKKSPPHEVLLIRGIVLRFVDHGRLSLLPPLSRRNQATRLIPLGSGWRRSKSIVIDLFQAVTGRKQPRNIQYGATSKVPPNSGRFVYRSASGPSYIFTIITGRNAILQGICPQVFGLFTVKLAGWPGDYSEYQNNRNGEQRSKNDDFLDNIWSIVMLRRYIHYVKQHFKPVLTKESERVISSYYQLQRRSAIHNADAKQEKLILEKLQVIEEFQ